MTSYIIYGLLVVALLFIFYVLIVAILASRKRTTSNAKRKNVEKDKLEVYVSKLSKMLKCKTVYTDDKKYENEFINFRKVLEEEFPLIHKQSELKLFDGCLVFKINGNNASKNILLMSHHDVVIDDGEWEHPAFGAEIHDGSIYARGAIDTKTPLFAELQAIE